MRALRWIVVVVLVVTAVSGVRMARYHQAAAERWTEQARVDESLLMTYRTTEPRAVVEARLLDRQATATGHRSDYETWAVVTAASVVTLILVGLTLLPGYAIPRERRGRWLTSMVLLAVGGILLLVSLGLPGREGKVRSTEGSVRSSTGVRTEVVRETVSTVSVGDVSLGRGLPVAVAAVVLLLFVPLLPLGRARVWHGIRTAAIDLSALLLVVNAAFVFVAPAPSYLSDAQLAHGSWLALASALLAGSGAALRVPLDWARRTPAPRPETLVPAEAV